MVVAGLSSPLVGVMVVAGPYSPLVGVMVVAGLVSHLPITGHCDLKGKTLIVNQSLFVTIM